MTHAREDMTTTLIPSYFAQIVSYQKMLGTLQDAGNTTTVVSYLRLLSHAFLMLPLERFSGSRIKQRGSTPKIIVLDNALVTAMTGGSFKAARKDHSLWGRLVENVVGAQLYWSAQEDGGELMYWRDRQEEVDFIIARGRHVTAVEVKLGKTSGSEGSLAIFQRRYPGSQGILISGSRLEQFFLQGLESES